MIKLEAEKAKHAENVLKRNHVTLDEIIPLCNSYADIKEWAYQLNTIGSSYYDELDEKSWLNDTINNLNREWTEIVWEAIKSDRWLCGSTCGWCLQLLTEQYINSKWYIPAPKVKTIIYTPNN